MECNRSFSDLVYHNWDLEYDRFFNEKNQLQLILAAGLAATPVFASAGGLVDDIAREATDELWGQTSTAINGGVEGLANEQSLANTIAGGTGAFTETALTVYLTRILVARLGASAAAAALPFLPEIAVVAAAFIVGVVVATLTKISVQAVEDYLAQGDNPSIYDLVVDGA